MDDGPPIFSFLDAATTLITSQSSSSLESTIGFADDKPSAVAPVLFFFGALLLLELHAVSMLQHGTHCQMYEYVSKSAMSNQVGDDLAVVRGRIVWPSSVLLATNNRKKSRCNLQATPF